MSPPSSLTIDSLPNEILFEIISHLFVDGLYTVSTLSRRFNNLAIPHFFPYHGCSEPSKVMKIRIRCDDITHALGTTEEMTLRRYDALAGLSIAFDVKSVEELRCTFVPCVMFHIESSKLKTYQRLLHVLRRLERVSSLSITFDYWKQSNVEQTRKERTEVVSGLLNACLEKGCKTLAIQHGYFVPLDGDTLKEPNKVLKMIKKLFSAPLREGAKSATAPHSTSRGNQDTNMMSLSSAARKSSRLTHLDISSAMLLCPPCSSWTYPLLETPNLTSLTLSRVLLEKQVWEVILPWLVPPLRERLLELSITHCSHLPVTPLVNLVTSMKKLTHFKLIGLIPSVENRRLRKKHLLPDLVSLHTLPDWIGFLCPNEVPRPLLESLRIVPNPRFDFGVSIRDIKPVLTNPALSRLAMNSNSSDEITLDISAAGYTTADWERDLQAYQDPTDRAACESYERVTSLMFHVRMVTTEMMQQSQVICKFFGWWKNVRRIEFVSDDWTWARRWSSIWTEEAIGELLKDAKVHCPSLQSLVVHREVYRIHED
ncbi:hypothetical protein BDN72DRAFT_848033 [Pluteus cervinus]|uniref:Uncharacterized protein n=1 Tax=Pluteus cervinus TaxID=181527 RepID=A0ACD3AB15_9AGAR|nr:hypothetical protein BDN72DRAFT_848033 [Pluteus cervinus]